ncbi:MAG: B12-binding domain-containing radical SAM protein [Syntrophobacterales bacterium CG_4_8_14_3_um_filter_58_8]|nr:MAG: B12-binding domain-containing radical SAM protein [Syntrophobacterales bacterium CG03_land_8_20_14_0_80_58_14]PJC75929.1 MAG: B12-binding domain-containing radical SAM protein [Syntrophobacterales bacterium CG_4_8_14_3_um_filter_58_8]
MKIALIYPPTCDPTAPYLSLPTLTGCLRAHGVEVWPIDANVEAYSRLLCRETLTVLAGRVEERWTKLKCKSALNHAEQLAGAALWEAREDARSAPGGIDDAVAVLRDRSGERFFDPPQYEAAIATMESALRLVSAAYAPLSLDFTAYRTPFSLLTIREIEEDARPERDPFHEYFQELCARLAAKRVGLVGLSVAFPGQVQPAYALAFMIRRLLPGVHVTVGGPAMTQILLRLRGTFLTRALKPFHSAVLFEGESALLELVRAVERGESPAGIIEGAKTTDLGALPAPDFAGLPLEQYFSPAPVLPYDPTRGCYWGKCAFCHYGLAECGAARYRERPVEQAAEHIRLLADRYGCRLFHFSQDSLSPKTARRLAEALKSALNPSPGGKPPVRWATDMRPEPALDQECCRVLAEGGALGMALGVESAAPRVLQLIHKGLSVRDAALAVKNLAAAGIAVEVMCFTDFPTETGREALMTARFIEELRDSIALFICGEFALVVGARVAQHPGEYAIRETWHVAGDEFSTALFYEESVPSKTPADRERIDDAIDRLARSWWLHRYPWAGSLSTAHTLLWYDRYGADVFRRLAGTRREPAEPRPGGKRRLPPRRDLEQVWQRAREHETEIWRILVTEKRAVSREAYCRLAEALPSVRISVRLN